MFLDLEGTAVNISPAASPRATRASLFRFWEVYRSNVVDHVLDLEGATVNNSLSLNITWILALVFIPD